MVIEIPLIDLISSRVTQKMELDFDGLLNRLRGMDLDDEQKLQLTNFVRELVCYEDE